MKRRFGGILCVILGAVLIGTGLSGSPAGSVGNVSPTCGQGVVGGVSPCPTGTIRFTETTTGTGATPPSDWIVRITSTCDDPLTGIPVDQTVTVANGGAASSTALELYANEAHSGTCSYAFTEESVPVNYTATFAPTSPQTIPDSGGSTGSLLDVALSNAYVAPVTTTAAPSSTTATTTAAAPTSTHASSASDLPTSLAAPSSAAPVANTGPHEQIRATVWIGSALCLLGLMLLVAGRRRRSARHS